MPDTRSHRGPHPDDAVLFGPPARPALCGATADLCWLLTRGYASTGAAKLVGDRFQLAARQRIAVVRAACSDSALAGRTARRLARDALRGRPLALDGYNVLTTVEAALAGGVILAARDGAYRDMASMHGSFRRVAETQPALDLIGRTAEGLGAAECHWYLDRPVSNSGRLRALMVDVATEAGWRWTVELVNSPDAVLRQTSLAVATADSAVLDRCAGWFNLARETVARFVPGAWVLELPGPAPGGESAPGGT